jgi:hypothetical protein
MMAQKSNRARLVIENSTMSSQVPLAVGPGVKVEIRNTKFTPLPGHQRSTNFAGRQPAAGHQHTFTKSAGWTRVLDEAKQSLPVQCPKCKTIFPSHAKFLPAIELELSGNTEPCPVCGYSDAVIAEGIFRTGQDTIEVLSADETNRAMLEAFLRIASQATAGTLSEKDAIKQAEAVSPKFGKIFENAFKYGLPGLGLLLTIANVIVAFHGQDRSARSASDLLQAVIEQTYVLKEIKDQKVQGQSANPPKAKTDQKSSTIKSPPRPGKKLPNKKAKRSKPGA